MDPLSGIKRVVIEEPLAESPLARKLKNRFRDISTVPEIRPAQFSGYDKNTLILTKHQGNFIKPCPGTPEYICCDLQIFHMGLGCNIGCSYCILQGYLDTEALVLFHNIDEGLAELDKLLDESGDKPFRFTSGEFTDSLLLEELTGTGEQLVRLFNKKKNALLELKTKTDNVHSLIGLPHNNRTVVSFSVNAPSVSKKEEARAVSVQKRIAAAKIMVGEGYRVGFHFDPIIRHPGWQDGYATVIHDIFSNVPSSSIAWISLGGFRYLPKHKKVMAARHPNSRIMYDDFVLAADGKMRYVRPLRVELYKHLSGLIKSASEDVLVYLCMESPRVWKEVFGFDPGPQGLTKMLDKQV